MRIPPIIAVLLATPCMGATERADLLRFGNGDQLHGEFTGIADGPSVLWKREDIKDAVSFKSSELRQIILQDGRPSKSLENLSHVGMVNGDRIPGIVREMDEKNVMLETEFGGMLALPRNKVGLLAPSPLGGRVIYHGPFDKDDWMMLHNDYPDGLPEAKDKKEDSGKLPQWNFSGSAWYWQDQGTGTALVRKGGMPDRAIIQFEMAWKNRLSIAIGFHSDFSKPGGDEAEGGEIAGNNPVHPASLPGLF
ncbi:MAG: hypothetical protein H7Y36_03255, partial [Armatimonadetes bacterium]|nr:hypothetical protein [Akkermansiaceae bacterium]